MTEKPYTVALLAERWGCSTTFVYEQIKCGALPAFKLGAKLYRIRHQNVEAYELRHETVPIPPT